MSDPLSSEPMSSVFMSRCRGPALNDELADLHERVQRFLDDVPVSVDDLEVWVCRTNRWSHRLEGQRLLPEASLDQTQVGFRLLKDNQMASTRADTLDPKIWQQRVVQAAAELAKQDGAAESSEAETQRPFDTPEPTAIDGNECVDSVEVRLAHLDPPERSATRFGRPACRSPHPFTFDPGLADALSMPGELRRIAFALADNTAHEADRLGQDIDQFKGWLHYAMLRRAVGTRSGVVTSLNGHLAGQARFGDAYGDQCHLVQSPESFLSVALLGARTFVHMPRERTHPKEVGLLGRVPVLLHPRALESIVRAAAEPVLAPTPATYRSLTDRQEAQPLFKRDDLVASPEVTLIEDSTIDGQLISRPFDDEGTQTRPNKLIEDGRLTQTLRDRLHRGKHALNGSAFRRPMGDEPVEAAPVRPGFGGIRVLHGDVEVQSLVGSLERAILVYSLASIDNLDPTSGRFSCRVAAAISVERGRACGSRLLAPDHWTLEGRLFSTPTMGKGMLEELVLSHEVYETGTGILPYCLTVLEVRAQPSR